MGNVSYSTPVFLLGKFSWQRSLGVPSTWGHRIRHHWQLNMRAGKVPFSFFYYWKTKPSIHCGNITCTHSQILLYTNIVSGGSVLSSSGLLGDMSPIKAPKAGSPNWVSLLHCISSPCTSLEHLLKLVSICVIVCLILIFFTWSCLLEREGQGPCFSSAVFQHLAQDQSPWMPCYISRAWRSILIISAPFSR